MKLGVLSDTHDNLTEVASALALFRQRQVEAIVHAGDFVAPFALKRILTIRLPVHAVFGNCDGERAGLAALLPDLADGPRHLELGGKKVCVIHDEKRLPREDFEAADLVIVGHSHTPKIERIEGRLIVNPGECCGWVTGRGTVAVVDTDRLDASIEDVYQQPRNGS